MRKRKILVGEPDEELRAVLCEILERSGFDPMASSCSQITLEILRSHRVLDLGFVHLGVEELASPDFVSQLGEATRRKTIPLALTSFSREVESISSQCRAAAWLVKPYDLEEFVRTARKFALTGP